MNERTRAEPVCVGVDLAKQVIQIHAVDRDGGVLTARALRAAGSCRGARSCRPAALSPWRLVRARTTGPAGLKRWGLDARILAGHIVSPFRVQGRTGKNDANDAAAVCEAARRPRVHVVPVKTVAQQSILCVHRLREGIKADRTACISRIRGLLAEFGIVLAQGPDVLRSAIVDILEGGSNELGGLARQAIDRALQLWRELDAHLLWCDQHIAAHSHDCADVKRASELFGVGPLTASAVVATVGDFSQFDSGAQFGAWIGLTPRQHSSGGKARLGGITKRGDPYLRSLMIQAAKSAVFSAHRRTDPISQWVTRLRQRSGWQIATVALANKNARILWAIMTRDQRFDRQHVSTKPLGAVAAAH